MKRFHLSWLTSLSLLFLLATPVPAQDALKDDLAKLQGKWKATVTTPEGTSHWSLEIKDNKTKVHVERDGQTIFDGESDFKLEKFGPFNAYTYYNVEVKAGDNAGQKYLTNGSSRSSVYKFTEEGWTTAGGFSTRDAGKPRLIDWTRVKP